MNVMELSRELSEIANVVETEEDPREASRRVGERIQQLKARGETVPAELEDLERRLLGECIAASQGR